MEMKIDKMRADAEKVESACKESLELVESLPPELRAKFSVEERILRPRLTLVSHLFGNEPKFAAHIADLAAKTERTDGSSSVSIGSAPPFANFRLVHTLGHLEAVTAELLKVESPKAILDIKKRIIGQMVFIRELLQVAGKASEDIKKRKKKRDEASLKDSTHLQRSSRRHRLPSLRLLPTRVL